MDRAEICRRARAVRWQQFLDMVDPNRELDEDERARRAKEIERVHLARASAMGARVRREKAARRRLEKALQVVAELQGTLA